MVAKADLIGEANCRPYLALLNNPIYGTPEETAAVQAENARAREWWDGIQSSSSTVPTISNGAFEYRNGTNLPYGWTLVGNPTITTSISAGLGTGLQISSGTDLWGILFTFSVKPLTWYSFGCDLYGYGRISIGSWDGYVLTPYVTRDFNIDTTRWYRIPSQNTGLEAITFQTTASDTSITIQLLCRNSSFAGYGQVQCWEGRYTRAFQEPTAAGTSIRVYDDGTLASMRPALDFIATANITTTVADDGANDWASVTLDTIQGITTTSTPQFLRMGLGTAATSFALTTYSQKLAAGDVAAEIGIYDTTAYGSTPTAGIMFAGKYNSAGAYAGLGALSVSKLNTTDGNTTSYMSFCTRLSGVGDIDERMRLSNAGLFIGGTPGSPFEAARQLEVYDGSSPQIRLSQTTRTNYVDLQCDGSGNYIVIPSSGSMLYQITNLKLRWADNATATIAPYLALERCRGTLASPADVANGDWLGTVYCSAYKNVWLQPAGILFKVTAAVGASSAPTSIDFATSGGVDIADPYTENKIRMRIGDNGYVYMYDGNTANAMFTFQNTAATPNLLASTATAQLMRVGVGAAAGATAALTFVAGSKIAPATDAVDGIQWCDKDLNAITTLDTTNNRFGIGTAAPSATLHVVSAGAVQDAFYVRPFSGNYDFNINTWGTITCIAGTSANWNVFGCMQLGAGDTIARLAFGLDSGNPMVAFGPGNAARDCWWLRSAGTMVWYVGVIASRVEAMRIDSTGHVGLGTGATVGAALEVLHGTEQIRASYSAAVFASHTVASTGVYTITQTGASLAFSKAVNVGTADLATGVGDFAAGLTGKDGELFFDQSAKTLYLYGANAANSNLYLYNDGAGLSMCGAQLFRKATTNDFHIELLWGDGGSAVSTDGCFVINSGGGADFGFIGMGTATPAAKLEILGDVEQARLSYSATVYRSNTVSSVGDWKIGGTVTGDQVLESEITRTIDGAVTDGYAGSLVLDPGYSAASALAVTRHNYIDVQNVSVAGAGPAAVTDACVFRFDAAAGTHKAVDAGSTHPHPTDVDAWVKINVNGTLYYLPAFTHKT